MFYLKAQDGIKDVAGDFITCQHKHLFLFSRSTECQGWIRIVWLLILVSGSHAPGTELTRSQAGGVGPAGPVSAVDLMLPGRGTAPLKLSPRPLSEPLPCLVPAAAAMGLEYANTAQNTNTVGAASDALANLSLASKSLSRRQGKRSYFPGSCTVCNSFSKTELGSFFLCFFFCSIRKTFAWKNRQKHENQ